jgi:hypothetical protein
MIPELSEGGAMPLSNAAGAVPDGEDPTALTQKAVERQAEASRDYIDGQIGMLIERTRGIAHTTNERFRGIDTATELLSATVNRVPTDLTKAITDILRLMDERDLRVQHRFDANEKLSQTESNLNQTALAAALAAQEKASAVSTGSLESRILSQGLSTDRAIEKNAELAAVAAAALGARVTQVTEQLTALSSQVVAILSGQQARTEQKVDTRGGAANIYGLVGMMVGVVSLIIAAVAVVIATR